MSNSSEIINTPGDLRKTPTSTNMNLIRSDIRIMIKYAVENGIQLPTGVNFEGTVDSANLIANYNEVIHAIAPATIQSIQYINKEIVDSKGERKWYQIPIFNKCLVIAASALVVLIGISLLPDVNEENQANGLLSSSGLVLLVNLIFVCSASLLGVMFYLLKTISTKIKNYTLLPVDSIEVNATIIIGVISGFIISELFPINSNALGGSIEINKMMLALLGGFSSDAIFSTLQAIVNKLKLLVTTT